MLIETTTVSAEHIPGTPTLLNRTCCWLFGHIPLIKIEESIGSIKEPDEPEREIVMRMVIEECFRCGKLLSVKPAGIVKDPA